MERSRLETVVYYAQMIQHQYHAMRNTYAQVQAAIRAEQRAFDNIRGITNVNSYAEFMAWYNRQLNFERDADQRFRNIRIRIGNGEHPLTDIEGIRGSLDTRFGAEYWERGFTDEQREAMWRNLGLSAANWTYQNTWANREEDLATRVMIRRGILDDEGQAMRGRQHQIATRLSSGEATDGEVLTYSQETLMEIQRLLMDWLMGEAEWRELQLAQRRIDNPPPEPLGVSVMWRREPVTRPIVQSGRFVDAGF